MTYLDLICVHGCVGDQNFGVFYFLRLVYSDPLIKQEALVKVGIDEATSKLLDDLNGVKVVLSL